MAVEVMTKTHPQRCSHCRQLFAEGQRVITAAGHPIRHIDCETADPYLRQVRRLQARQ